MEWAELYGLTDVWRWRNPHLRAYTCHSASHRSFSRIDLAYVGGSALSRVKDVRILPRGISDHATLLLTLELSSTPGNTLWRLSRFWVSDKMVDGHFRGALQEYWDVNPGSAKAITVWDTFKAYTRGRYQTIIARVRRERRADLVTAERKADLQEAQFLRTKDPRDYDVLQLQSGEVVRIRTSLTQKRLLAQAHHIFEQGERSGKLLAWLSREQTGGMCIPHIQGPGGDLRYTPDEINNCFVSSIEIFIALRPHTQATS